MCTLTWFVKPDGYQLFFNRDEQRSRVEAITPAFDPQLNAALPIDPQGTGTWIATAASGASWCLLNLYQYQQGADEYTNTKTNSAPRSRGKIIIDLLNALADPRSIEEFKACIDLKQYAPFTLCYFPPELDAVNPAVIAFCWDGSKLSSFNPTSPLISSAVCLAQVLKQRELLYQTICVHGLQHENRVQDKHQAHLAFHRSHIPQKGMFSVCMHREDAKTVSLTEIEVSTNTTKMTYYNGAPCTKDKGECIELAR
ncbi:NRDE family protein [Catenovulum sediminis]|uniref:NRDE family protein n=1 Tax=Catenovulum sediminis TaxID=1740262 RepID=A0ABV1REM3_9ALTE|nr:NRDE family protein [Catenovulum sediminis]